METAGAAIKHNVAPVATMMAAGLATASSCFLKKIHGLPNWHGTIKKDFMCGALSSLPFFGAALIGTKSSRLDFSIKNCLAIGGLGLLAHSALTMLYTKLEQGFMALEKSDSKQLADSLIWHENQGYISEKKVVDEEDEEFEKNLEEEKMHKKVQYITSALIPVSFAIAAGSIGIARLCKNYVS